VRALGGQRQAGDAGALRLHRGDVGFESVARIGIDDRADVHAHVGRVAQAQLGERALQHVQHAVGDVLLQAQHAQRRAALAGGVEGGGEHVGDHLLGQGGGVHDHRVLAAGLGDQRHVAAARGEGAVDQRGDLGGAGEHHAAHARIGHQRGADGLAAAGQQLQGRGRDAGLVQQAHREGGDQRRLLGGFGEHRVAGRERGGDLAAEDREREVPRADAQHRAERQVAGGIEATRLLRVVAQEVDCLAQLGDRVSPRLAGLAHGQRQQGVGLALEQGGGVDERVAARAGRGGSPFGRSGAGGGQGALDVGGRGLDDAADDVGVVGWVAHRLGSRRFLRRACIVPCNADCAIVRCGGSGPSLSLGSSSSSGSGGQGNYGGRLEERAARCSECRGDARAHRLAGEIVACGVGA